MAGALHNPKGMRLNSKNKCYIGLGHRFHLDLPMPMHSLHPDWKTLSLDEKLDLHGCKCDVNKVTNINNNIYSWIYVHANVKHVYRHIYSYTHNYYIYCIFTTLFTSVCKSDVNLHYIYDNSKSMLTPALPHLI